MIIARVEGGLELAQDSEGRRVLVGTRPLGLESRLAGRSALDALYLSQQISAGNGISHALASARAWESAGGLPVAPNGELLRELLNLLSFLHHHVEQFYFQALPDYLPLAELAEYAGSDARVLRVGAGLQGLLKRARSAAEPQPRFPAAIRRRLAEHVVEAPQVLALVQRALARLGGKYPVAMCVAPGGVTTAFGEQDRLRIDGFLRLAEPFLAEAPMDDALTVFEHYPELGALGRGAGNFLSVGGGVRLPEGGGELFPSGVLLGRRLQSLPRSVTEGVERAFYRITRSKRAGAPVLEEAPDKDGAYSWIKAPRVGGEVVETGAIARLAIIQLSGVHGRCSGTAELIQDQLGVPPSQANTVAGRMLARMGEVDLALRRCQEILRTYETGHATIEDSGDPMAVSGEGVGYVESPSGAIRHRVMLEEGRIQYYDIISASTWNGSSRDRKGGVGALESALTGQDGAPDDPAVAPEVSRIVHSFAFSASDAVH
jgi:Ni,Fe-hydrogenase I large subunit